MGNRRFEFIARMLVRDWYNANASDKAIPCSITIDEVYVVWICKTLQNNKALLSTIVEDGMYYEVTYNGDKDEFYFDAYKKQENACIPADQWTRAF